MTIARNTVKICSLRSPEHVGYVVETGADLFGLIFADARRRVSVQVAREIVDESRRLVPNGELRSVGVFVDHSPTEINRIADVVGLDFVQLHRTDALREGIPIERPVLLAIRTAPGMTHDLVDAEVAAVAESGSALAGLIVDGFKVGSYGGSGTTANWSFAREVAARYPVLLAGGLTPENVQDGIDAVHPYGVDVSSGVETDGQKDEAKIEAFVRNARAALERLSVGEVNAAPLGQATHPVEGAQSLL